MRKFATYIVAKPGVAPGTMLKLGYCRASFIIGIALAYGHKKSPKNGAFVYKSVYKFCKSLIFKVYCGERGTNNFFIIACHTISFPLKYNAFKAKVTSCNITQYHKTRIKSCTKPCT